jgi:hypothetical protein
MEDPEAVEPNLEPEAEPAPFLLNWLIPEMMGLTSRSLDEEEPDVEGPSAPMVMDLK